MTVAKRNSIKKVVLILVLIVIATRTIHAQDHKVTIKVLDSVKFPVGNATVRINQKEKLADSTGLFPTTLPNGRYRVTVSAVGHYAATRYITISQDTTIQVFLRSRESLLQNVVVTANRNVLRNQMSVHNLDMAQIRKLPVILGEVDPIKTITLLPGIKNGGEASAGIYVRGGGPDQNLVLLDGIPVYNPNHLLGFFSVFNGDAVKILK